MRTASILAAFLALSFLSGCAAFMVKDTSGIKSMLNNRLEAEHLLSRVKAEYAGDDKDQIIGLYDKACLENNKWIAGIQLDIQTKDVLAVKKNDYASSSACKSASQFIERANLALPNPKGLAIENQKDLAKNTKGPAIEISQGSADIVYGILKVILETHNQNVEKARERIYNELEKAKWKTAK